MCVFGHPHFANASWAIIAGYGMPHFGIIFVSKAFVTSFVDCVALGNAWTTYQLGLDNTSFLLTQLIRFAVASILTVHRAFCEKQVRQASQYFSIVKEVPCKC